MRHKNPFALSLSKDKNPFALGLSKGLFAHHEGFDRFSPNGECAVRAEPVEGFAESPSFDKLVWF
jgi:hypothetical protein